MSDDIVARINMAVDHCLDRCLGSENPPLATLAEFCDELADDPQWSDHEIELVKSIVIRVLGQTAKGGE